MYAALPHTHKKHLFYTIYGTSTAKGPQDTQHFLLADVLGNDRLDNNKNRSLITSYP